MMQVNFLHESSGVWVLPTRTFAAVYGQRLCLLFSKISYPQNMMLPLSPKPGAFLFSLFSIGPLFFSEKMSVVKWKEFFPERVPSFCSKLSVGI